MMPDNENPPSATVATSGQGWRVMFLGPEGVRAGWRLLIFLALIFVFSLATRPLQLWLIETFGERFTATNVILSRFIEFSIVLLATAAMGRFERRRLADYGMPFRLMFRTQFWAGALWGFVMVSFIIAMMAATHAYSAGGLALSPGGIVKYGLLWALGFLMVGLFEESLFRGYAQFTLTTGLGFWPAAGITCTLFAAVHLINPGENWVGIVEIVLIAGFLVLTLRRTGSLWFAIGWHMAFDWGESFFYSTPDSGIQATGHLLKASLMGSTWLSGGSVGPEASVFDVIVTVAGILLLAKVYPEAKYPASAALVATQPPQTEETVFPPPA